MATRDTLVKRPARSDSASTPLKAAEGQLPASTGSKYDDDELRTSQYARGDAFTVLERNPRDMAIALALLIVSAALRFYQIYHPSQVVFDEVHFGRVSPLFLNCLSDLIPLAVVSIQARGNQANMKSKRSASFYIRREFFFDVHPPLSKLLLAFAGWVIGYDGHFEFDNIGDDYILNKVPYIGLRALPAIFGSLTPPVIYAIMRESGYPRVIGLFSALLIVFDNAHIAQARLILLDAPMLFFMAIAIYAYVRFYKLRYNEFSKSWWTWMVTTGIFLSLTLSCKMNGLLTFMTVGTAVAVDLWNILDYRRGLSNDHVFRHFMARVYGLIVIPAIVYLFWFWVHFAVLTKSGPGDDFMSPAFQQTLQDSPMTFSSKDIFYHDRLRIQHKQTKAYLHSHPDRYPLKYPDGRISSNGQQVTAYDYEDTNNEWIVLPTVELTEGERRPVKHDDIIRLYHPNTDSVLLSHDVASPLMPTNTEFTTIPIEDNSKYNATLFRLDLVDKKASKVWRSKSGHFNLFHVSTGTALWTHAEPLLPEWAFKQQEVNGNKNVLDKTNVWFVDSIIPNPNATEEETTLAASADAASRKVKSRNFFLKFLELQVLMLQHNAGLTDSHPYASGPINWPFLINGISFWTSKAEHKEQIYLYGNVVGWWFCVAALSIFVGIFLADVLARRRGIHPIEDHVLTRFYNSTGFFWIGWAWHYFPFYLMNRQLFLHHYLPAHVMSVLLAGSVLNFICTETINYPVSLAGPLVRRRARLSAQIGLGTWAAVGGIVLAVVASFLFFAPLTYGTPGLDPIAVNRRRILSSITLHFAK